MFMATVVIDVSNVAFVAAIRALSMGARGLGGDLLIGQYSHRF